MLPGSIGFGQMKYYVAPYIHAWIYTARGAGALAVSK